MADIKNYFNLKQENDSLREENNVLLNENRSLREFASESLRLKEMLGFSHRSDFKLYPASVIGRDATNFFNTLIIDKGLNDGIRQDMVVVNNIGIIGRVVSVSNNNAKVILLSDSNCSISAIDSRSRVYGLVAGVGGTNCVMKYVSVDDDVKVGDTVISSGDGEIFPKGFLIGRVCKVEKSRDELMLDIYVRPVVKFSTLEEVFVVLK